MIKLSDDDIYFWYEHVEQYRDSPLGVIKYCETQAIDRKKFQNMYYRFLHCSKRNPAQYKLMVSLGRKYLEAPGHSSKFSKEHNVNVKHLQQIVTHLNYIDAVERINKLRQPPSMEFIRVAQKLIPSTYPEPPEHEVVEKQNDIEIIITKGVKVSISPTIDSMKIIKIIELLKDL